MDTRPHISTTLSKGVVFGFEWSQDYCQFNLGFPTAWLKEPGQRIAIKVLAWIAIGLTTSFGAYGLRLLSPLLNNSAPEQLQHPKLSSGFRQKCLNPELKRDF
jgi:hypothetical protein